MGVHFGISHLFSGPFLGSPRVVDGRCRAEQITAWTVRLRDSCLDEDVTGQ